MDEIRREISALLEDITDQRKLEELLQYARMLLRG